MGNRKPHDSQSQKNPTPPITTSKVRGFTPIVNDPNHPPYDGFLYPGRMEAYGGHEGTWAGALEGDVAMLVGKNDVMQAQFYNNVEGNPKWFHPSNPSYRWDGSRWVRP